MQYIAFLQLDGFMVQALGLKGLAVVHDESLVRDATTEALAAGVEVGMSLAEARAALDGRGEFRVLEPSRLAAAQEVWLEKVSTYSDVVEPLEPHQALVDLSAHPRPHEVFARMVRRLEKATGLKVRHGAGRSRWVARLAASLGDPNRLALFCPAMFVAQLPTHLLLEVEERHRERLVTLGYRKIGEVAELPLATLTRLFKEDAFGIHLAARGGGSSEVRALFPRSALAMSFRFEGAATDGLTFERGVIACGRQLGEEILARGLAGKIIEAVLEFEDGGLRHVRRHFAKPISDVRTAVCAARLLLSRLPEQPVVSLRLRAPQLEVAAAAQLGLHGLKSRKESSQNAHVAALQIREQFGPQSIELAAARPTPRRKQVLAAWQEVYGWR